MIFKTDIQLPMLAHGFSLRQAFFLLVFVILSAGCTAHFENEGVRYVIYDEGGFIDLRAEEIKRLKEKGTRVEIGDGNVCISACTMYLALENTCVHPNAVLGFHSAISGSSAKSRHQYNRIMANHYPPEIRSWFYTSGASEVFVTWKTLKGSEAIEMGAKAC